MKQKISLTMTAYGDKYDIKKSWFPDAVKRQTLIGLIFIESYGTDPLRQQWVGT
jgi:hypothetical protein